MPKKRLVAKRVKIKDIIEGKYFKQEGFEPNYIITSYGLRISRISVVATVVDIYMNEDKTYGAVTFDDGTEIIRAKYFQDLTPIEDISVGDIVEVIGKVKKYNEEIYIVAEFVFKRSPEFELLRNVEYVQFRKNWSELVKKIREKIKNNAPEKILEEFKAELTEEDFEGILQFFKIENEFSELNTRQIKEEINPNENKEFISPSDEKTILNMIDKLDTGDGAEYSEIMKNSNMTSEIVESIINNLLSDGSCYEPRPGKIKRL